ncbi:hypothetical protein, partial [Arthrobacter bambusae]|uniref:hypothetical protein n=1 Tax=Arthrobacter bambusae TaxID=1338426 RepID=UPI0027D86962
MNWLNFCWIAAHPRVWWSGFQLVSDFVQLFLPLFPVGMVVFVFVFTSTESLILAQDERWRRA